MPSSSRQSLIICISIVAVSLVIVLYSQQQSAVESPITPKTQPQQQSSPTRAESSSKNRVHQPEIQPVTSSSSSTARQSSSPQSVDSSAQTIHQNYKIDKIPRVPEQVVLQAVTRCNEDLHNNPGRHISCVLLKNAAVFPDGSVRYSKEDNEGGGAIPKRYPPVGKTRYFLRESQLVAVAKDELGQLTQPSSTTNVGIFQHPVSGAAFDNVWHTLSDFAFILFDTISPFISFVEDDVEKKTGTTVRKQFQQQENNDHENFTPDEKSLTELRAPITWILFPPGWSNFRDILPCKTESVCRAKVLFEPFTKFFARIFFMNPSSSVRDTPPILFEYLIVGMATSCSPIPTQGVGTTRCKTSLKGMRDHLLMQFGISPFKVAFASPPSASSSEKDKNNKKNCPSIHLMSRQKGRYRRMHPFEKIVSALEKAVLATDHCPVSSNVVKSISLSKSMTFRDQLLTIVDSDFLVAGRGGGTGLSIFLPLNSVYISISGSDRWNPYRDLVPPWLELIHHEAKLVDPFNEKLNCKPTKKGYVDANKCDYLLQEPEKLGGIVSEAMKKRMKLV